MAHDVFISVSSNDKPVGDAVCAVLEASGIRCWIAPRDIAPGAEWAESIIDAIADARCVVLVFSQHANTSPQIRREVERAVNKGITVIPLRVEDVQPSKTLEYFISTPHWLDAFTPPLERHLNRLAQAVQLLLQHERNNTRTPEGSAYAADASATVADRPPTAVRVSGGSVPETAGSGAAAPPARRWSDTSPHPWRRVLARTFDGFAVVMVLAIVLAVVDAVAGTSLFQGFDRLFDNLIVASIVTPFLVIPFNVVLIGLTGGTLGKWLFGVRVLGPYGRKVGLRRGFEREIWVWSRGEGLGVPFVNLITGIAAYRQLINTGATSWDREADFTIVHRPGGLRQNLIGGAAVSFVAAIIIAGAIGTASNENPMWQACAAAFNRNDFSAALSPCRKAAEQGHANAQNVLGFMYLDGKGLPKDNSQALAWFLKAALEGHSTAQQNIAWMYATGTGVTKDLALARSWYEKAAANGSEGAKKWLAENRQ